MTVLGSRLFPQKRGVFTAKPPAAASTKVSGNYTRVDTGRLVRGPLGNFSGKPLAPNPKVSLSGTESFGTRLFPQRKSVFTARSIFVPPSSAKVSGSYTRFGARLFSQNQLGNFLGKPSVQPTIVNLPVGHFTFTPRAFSAIVQDTIIDLPSAADETFTAIPFSIEQGGNVVDFPLQHLTFTPNVFLVEQQNASDHIINLPAGNITFTPVAFSVINESSVDLPTGHLTFTPNPIDVSITLPGSQTLTQADILAIWNNISVTGYTPLRLLEIISAATAGLMDIEHGPGGSRVYEFQAVDGSKVVITADTDPQGRRVNIVLTP